MAQQVLNLSAKQIAAIDRIATELAEFQKQLDLDGQQNRAAMKEHESAANERCRQLLTDEQRDRFKLLQLAWWVGPSDALDEVRNFESELDLTDEQHAYFEAARAKRTNQRLDMLEKELEGKLDEGLIRKLLQRDSVQHSERTDKNVEAKLTESQHNRLIEMRWRYAMMVDGLAFFARPEIQEFLKLTDAEKAEIKRNLADANKSEDRFERAGKMYGDTYKEYLRSLSSRRIDLLKSLVGPPIKGDGFMKKRDPLKDF